MRELLNRQRKSREKLALAAARYANLRAGDGPYAAPPIRTMDRAGRPVTVLLRLDIVSEEETKPFCPGCPDHEACSQGACYLNGGPTRPGERS